MSIPAWLFPLLRCPDTAEALAFRDGKLHAAKQAYPFLNEVPWLFKNPGMALLEWGTKIQNFCEQEKQQIVYLQQSALSASGATKTRLNALREAKEKNLAYLKKSLEAFLTYPPIPIQPDTQQVNSYFHAIFRDWSWPSDELSAYVNFCLAHIPENATVLVLGSGAGGLSYQLAQANRSAKFVSFEHNPFLALTAQHLMQGKELKLTEVCLFPRALTQTSQRHTMKTQALADNHHTVMGSFPALPFAEKSFDVVITPWFLDILDMPFNDALLWACKPLNDEGQLLFFGPANVHKPLLEEQWCSDEIDECFNACFQQVKSHSEDVFYMDSPLNAQRRQECVHFVAAKGVSHRIEKPQKTETLLKLTPELLHYKTNTEIIAKVLAVIDQDIDVPSLSHKLIQQFGFSEKDAPYYAEVFIRKIRMNLYQV